MMTKLERLIDLLIAYLEQQLGGEPRTGDEKPAPRARTKKEKTPEAAATPTQPPAPTPAPAATQAAEATTGPSDKETYDELARLAAAYIEPKTPGDAERRTKAVSHVSDTYKVDALSKVPHGPQRQQLIAWFKDQLVEKQKAAAAASAPSGFGV